MAPVAPTNGLLVEIPKHGFLRSDIRFSKSSKKRRALCHYFGGVPYARPPTGSNRWKRPQKLPIDFSYGSKDQPQTRSGTGICPQSDVKGRSLRKKWSEDCLQSNIWVPFGKPPSNGWPVFFFIRTWCLTACILLVSSFLTDSLVLDGGFLQWGHPNDYDFSLLLGETDCKCVIVTPAYRLNAFGFLASEDLQTDGDDAGNFGFWDQRLALEWTAQNIKHFGGNPGLITLGGFSAGGYSVFHQLAYDLLVSPARNRPLIKRVFVQSNGPGLQPRSAQSALAQFDELIAALGISTELSSEEKLKILRATPAAELISATEKMKLHEFRAVSDDSFVSKLLFDRIDDGTLAGLLNKHNIEILLSEVKDECTTYAEWRPPKSVKLRDIRGRLRTEYYPEEAVDAIINQYKASVSKGSGPCQPKSNLEVFGEMYSGVQVHLSQRGFADKIAKNGAGHLVRRVRTEWLTSTARRWTAPSMGVTHGTDTPIWFWGNGEVLEEGEKGTVRAFVADFFWAYLNGENVQQMPWWKRFDANQIRTLTANGEITNEEDVRWEDGKRFWDAVRESAVYDM